MPSPTFTIEYNSGDFFYNTVDTAANAPLLYTFPFKKENLIQWANDVAQPNPPISSSVNDIFDPQITAIVFNPAYDFQNTFLPGNIVFNNNFNQITLDLTTSANRTMEEKTRPITGNIVLVPSSGGIQTVLDITQNNENSSASNIHWTQDSLNSWQSSFDLNANVSQEIPFTDSDGGTSTIIMTTGNPRCKYRKKCTINHWHYEGPCTTQIIKDNAGNTTCKCICSGNPVFNDKEHSHCDDYTIDGNGLATTVLGPEAAPTGLGLLSTVQSIKMNLNSTFPQMPFVSSGGNVVLPYKDKESLEKRSKKIRRLIYDYYYEVSENIRLQKTIQNRGSKDVTSKQSLLDATVLYKKEYLNVFNIAIGIVGAVGYIYIMGKAALAGKPSVEVPK